MRMWIFGCSWVNLATWAFRVRYSALWLTGGGGVSPIHSTRFTCPFGPLAPVPLPPEEHAAASMVTATAMHRPNLFIGHLCHDPRVNGAAQHRTAAVIPPYGMLFCIGGIILHPANPRVKACSGPQRGLYRIVTTVHQAGEDLRPVGQRVGR